MKDKNTNLNLDIFDILGIFFSQKIITFSLTLIFFLYSFYYTSKFIPKTYFVETYKLQSLNQTESVPIKILNDQIVNLLNNNLIVQTLELGEIDLVKYYDKKIEVQAIESNTLIASLFSKFQDQEIKDIINSEFKSDYEFPRTVVRMKVDNTTTYSTIINLQFTHNGNEEEFYKQKKYEYSRNFIDTGKLLLIEDLRKNISYALKASKISIKQIINQLEEQNIQLTEKYKLNVIEKIYNLKEQALIARELNIESPWDATGSDEESNNTSETSNVELKQQVFGSSESSSRTDYLRGYKAIEKEIQILESRADIIPYVPQIQSNIIAIQTLAKENFLDEDKILLNIGLDNTGLDDFRFIKEKTSHYTTSTSFISVGLNAKQFQVIFTLLGFFLGIFYALVSYAYSRKIG